MHDILTLRAAGSDAMSNFWNVQLSGVVHLSRRPPYTCNTLIIMTYKAHFPLTHKEWGSFNDRLYAFVTALMSYPLRFILVSPRCFYKVSLCTNVMENAKFFFWRISRERNSAFKKVADMVVFLCLFFFSIALYDFNYFC